MIFNWQNVENLKTDHLGAQKYPFPKGELVVISGNINWKRFLYLTATNENDGIVLLKKIRIGVWKRQKNSQSRTYWDFIKK